MFQRRRPPAACGTVRVQCPSPTRPTVAFSEAREGHRRRRLAHQYHKLSIQPRGRPLRTKVVTFEAPEWLRVPASFARQSCLRSCRQLKHHTGGPHSERHVRRFLSRMQGAGGQGQNVFPSPTDPDLRMHDSRAVLYSSRLVGTCAFEDQDASPRIQGFRMNGGRRAGRKDAGEGAEGKFAVAQRNGAKRRRLRGRGVPAAPSFSLQVQDDVQSWRDGRGKRSRLRGG
ncbi:hypothetical protein EXIGLDRAFT_234050 [Exidia glandulosa HHB12029]|uniref:Uncharacterized protein n=1 Tax=Exidia glandulosa HHB12029 TaxID=1314781 RepID=A0A165MJK6_EXIGL|nr:hypothetical protein EXIGLDRAFT_234050 [Exidia glandulosa HHB12029]